MLPSKCCAGWLCALLACLLSADSQDDLRSTAFTLTLAILLLATGAASAVMILCGPWNGKEKKTNKAKGKAMAKAKAKAKAIPLPSHIPEPQPLTAFISMCFRRAPEANRGKGAGFPAPDLGLTSGTPASGQWKQVRRLLCLAPAITAKPRSGT